MAPRQTKRYCVPPHVLKTLHQDGIGWGHDVDSGCFHAPRLGRPSLLNRMKRKVLGG